MRKAICPLCGKTLFLDSTTTEFLKHVSGRCVPGHECEDCDGTGQIETCWYNKHGHIVMTQTYQCRSCMFGYVRD